MERVRKITMISSPYGIVGAVFEHTHTHHRHLIF